MTARPRYPRTSCCVPFCTRTSTLFPHEWVCGKHWRLVDPALKRLRTRMLHRRRRLSRRRMIRIDELLWQRIKRQAIERAATTFV